jgi:hypothetical protein
VSCRSDCQQLVAEGEVVHLVAFPESDMRFTGWEGDCTGTGTCDLAMSSNRSVIATFAWLATITVALNGTGSGRVTSLPSGIDCPGSCTVTVHQSTALTLTASSDDNSTFLGWGGACRGAKECPVLTWGDQTIWANFQARTPRVSTCGGIAPPDTPPVTQYVEAPRYEDWFGCGGAAADTSGTLALVLNGAHGDSFLFFSPSGAPLGVGGATMFTMALPQPTGFSFVSGRPYLGPPSAIRYGQLVSNFDSAGKSTGPAYLENRSGGDDVLPTSADPNGGLLLAGDLALAPSDPTVHGAVTFDGGGMTATVRWGPKPLASVGRVFGVGVDLLHRSLVVTDGASRFGSGNISAQWFDKDGTSLTGEFVLLDGFSAGPSTWFEMSALIGGGLVVRRMDAPSSAVALVVVGSGSERVSPAPEWMVARRNARLQIARGGKAYAVLPLGAKAISCTQRVEVVAPDGTSCGSTDYPIGGARCDTLDLLLGADGTVIQRLPTAMEVTNDIVGGQTCTWRWWSAAVR